MSVLSRRLIGSLWGLIRGDLPPYNRSSFEFVV
jgi:hypothetical protein